RRPPRALESDVWKGAFSRNRPVLPYARDRISPPGKCLRRTQTFDAPPAGSVRRRDRDWKLAEETPASEGPIGNHADSRMARQRPPGDDARRRSVIQREALPFALGSSTRDHWQSVVGTAVLWAAIACDGEQSWNALNHRFDAARSILASRPKKDWSRTSTRCTRSARRAKRSSKAKPVKDGVWSSQLMMTAVCPAGRWSGRHCSVCWLTSI